MIRIGGVVWAFVIPRLNLAADRQREFRSLFAPGHRTTRHKLAGHCSEPEGADTSRVIRCVLDDSVLVGVEHPEYGSPIGQIRHSERMFKACGIVLAIRKG